MRERKEGRGEWKEGGREKLVVPDGFLVPSSWLS